MSKSKRRRSRTHKPSTVEHLHRDDEPLRFHRTTAILDYDNVTDGDLEAANAGGEIIRNWGLGTIQTFFIDGFCDLYFSERTEFDGAQFIVGLKSAPGVEPEPGESPQTSMDRMLRLEAQGNTVKDIVVAPMVHPWGTNLDLEQAIRNAGIREEDGASWGAILVGAGKRNVLHILQPEDAERFMTLAKGAWDSYIDAQTHAGGNS